MGFSNKMLNPGEEVVVDVRPHWKFLFMPAIAVAVVVAGCVAALVEDVPQWALIALGALLVVCLLWLAGRYLKWTTTSFVVTNERLVLRRGVLKRFGREILLDRLTDISCNQTLSDRVLRCGDVLLESPGRDSPEVFPDLPHPVAIQNEIYRLISMRRGGPPIAAGGWPHAQASPPPGVPATVIADEGLGGPAQPVATPAAPTVAEQLSQLDDLRRRGVISRREFAAKKAELLSRM